MTCETHRGAVRCAHAAIIHIGTWRDTHRRHTVGNQIWNGAGAIVLWWLLCKPTHLGLCLQQHQSLGLASLEWLRLGNIALQRCLHCGHAGRECDVHATQHLARACVERSRVSAWNGVTMCLCRHTYMRMHVYHYYQTALYLIGLSNLILKNCRVGKTSLEKWRCQNEINRAMCIICKTYRYKSLLLELDRSSFEGLSSCWQHSTKYMSNYENTHSDSL